MLIALAYWWLGNLTHEIVGVALIVLLAQHLWSNRRWFANLRRGAYPAARMLSLFLHLSLAIAMLILAATSIVISKTVFASLPLPDSILLREFHWFAAYWAMIVIGAHIGLHWGRIIAGLEAVIGRRVPAWPGWLLLAVTLPTSLLSIPALDLPTKLSFGYSLDFWDFNASVLPFFLHWLCVLAVPAAASRGSLLLLRKVGR